MDAQKAADSDTKTNSIEQLLSIWVPNDSDNCTFDSHEAQKHQPRQNIFVLQNKNKVKEYETLHECKF